jgi:glyoxylase-like metal-dependent hydrolase (beta-lactamase superfamily II)
MIKVKRLVFNPIQVNTYVIYDETGDCMIIDPGMISEHEIIKFVDTINYSKLKPVKILLTHAHLDHVFGCSFMFKKYGLLPAGHKDDEFILENTMTYAKQFGISLSENPPKLGKYLDEGDTLFFGNALIKIIHVPGHSPGSLVYYMPDIKTLFSGDVLFQYDIGRTDLEGGNHEQLIKGIKEKLMTLHDEIIVFHGHGARTTIGDERKKNRYIREH